MLSRPAAEWPGDLREKIGTTMKKNAIKELREKSVEALKQDLVEAQRQVFAIRSQAVTQKVENPHQGKTTRHQVARIKTLLREKQLANAAKK